MNRTLRRFALFIAGAIVSIPASATAQPPLYYPVPAWDQLLTARARFVLVLPVQTFGPQAVLDRETGLVWQRVPAEPRIFEWANARNFCRTENTGGRMGWRLPTVEELSSLLDLSPGPSDPGLPPGHPFDLRNASPFFWSSSVDDFDPTRAYAVTVIGETAELVPGVRVFPKDFRLRVWCVRGGQGDHP